MVNLQDKKRALIYLAGLLEDSGLYDIRTTTPHSLSFSERSGMREVPRNVEILFPNLYGTIADFEQAYRQNTAQGIFTVPIFYKDGTTSYVRLVEPSSDWRQDKSLKNYTEQQINQMLHLRGIEKKVVDLVGGGTFAPSTTELQYYQPPTNKLPESLRIIQLQPVDLDYSHIPRDDPRSSFVQNRKSINYKLPQDLNNISPAAHVLFPATDNRYYKLAQLASAPKQNAQQAIPSHQEEPSESIVQRAHRELQQTAQRAYPDLDPNEAYQLFFGDKE